MAKVEWQQFGSIAVNGEKAAILLRRANATRYKNYKYIYLDENAVQVSGYTNDINNAYLSCIEYFVSVMPSNTAYTFSKENV